MRDETRVHLLVLDGSIHPATYRPVAQWARHLDGVPLDAVRLSSGEPVPRLDRYTHVLLTGSEACILQDEPWFEAEEAAVREAVERGLAILGSCFGHQMLVRALSGSEYIRRAPTPELGWVQIALLRDDALLSGIPNPWHVFAGHLDEVVVPPPPWRVIAANDACAVQAIRYGERPVWGIQPHPETEPDEGRAIMAWAIDAYPEHASQIRAALEEPVRDDRVTPVLIDAFLRANVQRHARM